jgi:hypothetical protein
MFVLIILGVEHLKKSIIKILCLYYMDVLCMLAHNAAARLFLNDGVAIYFRCVSDFMLGSNEDPVSGFLLSSSILVV